MKPRRCICGSGKLARKCCTPAQRKAKLEEHKARAALDKLDREVAARIEREP